MGESSMSVTPSNAGGEATAIVRTLRDYKSNRKSLPIAFLARAIGRQPEDLDESLRSLKAQGVIRIDESKGEVSLTPQ
jgi:predicted transcriptional regulator